MPLRFLRDIVFNDSEKTVPNALSMQQQLQSLGIFTTLEQPVQHPLKVFCKELLYYSAMAFVITVTLLSIILPATERFLSNLPDGAFFIRELKEFLHIIKG